MNFSTNQVMQFYALEGVTAEVKKYPLENAVVIEFTEGSEKRVSDKLQNVMWGKLTTADALAKPYKKVTLTASAVEVGKDYVVRVSYPEIAGLGIEGWTTKTAVYHAETTTVADLYTAIVNDLNKIFEVDGVLEADATNGINIYAKDVTPFYKKGVRAAIIPDFKVETNEGWSTKAVGTVSGRVVSSGYAVSEMEYFAMGERGDQYRMMGWPDVIDTKYKVIPSKEYDVLVVHYAYKGANENDYKSEKDLIIVGGEGTLDTLAAELARDTNAIFTKVDASETVITPAVDATEEDDNE